MKLPMRAAPPTIAALPVRTPGANLDRLVEVESERNSLLAQLDAVSRERDELDAESERLCKERDELVRERDDLSARSLPFLDTPSWPEVPDRGSPIGDELAAQYGGWPA